MGGQDDGLRQRREMGGCSALADKQVSRQLETGQEPPPPAPYILGQWKRKWKKSDYIGVGIGIIGYILGIFVAVLLVLLLHVFWVVVSCPAAASSPSSLLPRLNAFSDEPLSRLLVSPLISPIVVPYITPYIYPPFKEFRL